MKKGQIKILGILIREYPFTNNKNIIIFYEDVNEKKHMSLILANSFDKKLMLEYIDDLIIDKIDKNLINYKPINNLILNKKEFIENLRNNKCKMFTYKNKKDLNINKELFNSIH